MRSAIFHEDPPGRSVVALTDFDAVEVASFRSEIVRLARRHVETVMVGGTVRLILRTGEHDVGILEPNGTDAECVLRPASWLQVAGLLEPFAEAELDGFQWLDDTGPVRLLISKSGRW